MIDVVRDNSESICVTYLTRAKHTDLWKAAKRLGSQKSFAEALEISQQLAGSWINFKRYPKESSLYEAKLFELTGKTIDELWPPELCRLIDKKPAEVIEREQIIPIERLTNSQQEQLSLPDYSSQEAESNELKQDLKRALKTLSYREREIIKLRYGLGDGYSFTLEECAHVFKVTRERISQIEAKALRKLQDPSRSCKLSGHVT